MKFLGFPKTIAGLLPGEPSKLAKLLSRQNRLNLLCTFNTDGKQTSDKPLSVLS